MGWPRELWVRRLLTLGWAAVGLAPAASAVTLIRTGWAAVADAGLIAAMAVDSLSLDPPLLGMPSSLGFEGGAPLSHAGPLGLWLLAIPAKLLGEPGFGLILGALLLNTTCVAGIALLLRRRGDLRLEMLALVLVAAMSATMGGDFFANPWNPNVGVMPVLLCLLAVWGVLNGHHRQLWVVAFAGSLAAQTHLGYLPLVASLVTLTLVVLAIDVARTSGKARRRLTRQILPVGALIGLLAWIGPIIDQVFGTQNLARLWRSQSGDRPTAGIDHGVDLAVEMTSLPPRWLLVPRQATFARFTSSRSVRSWALRFRQAM